MVLLLIVVSNMKMVNNSILNCPCSKWADQALDVKAVEKNVANEAEMKEDNAKDGVSDEVKVDVEKQAVGVAK